MICHTHPWHRLEESINEPWCLFFPQDQLSQNGLNAHLYGTSVFYDLVVPRYETCMAFEAETCFKTTQLSPCTRLAGYTKPNLLYGTSVIWRFSCPHLWDLHGVTSWTCMVYRWFDNSVIPKYGTCMVYQAELVVWHIDGLMIQSSPSMGLTWYPKLNLLYGTSVIWQLRIRLAWYSKPNFLCDTSVFRRLSCQKVGDLHGIPNQTCCMAHQC